MQDQKDSLVKENSFDGEFELSEDQPVTADSDYEIIDEGHESDAEEEESSEESSEESDHVNLLEEEEDASDEPDSSVEKKSFIDHRKGGLNHREQYFKSKNDRLREKAFKKMDMEDVDPALLDHRANRRQLAEQLEEDSEFKRKYIKIT